MTGPVSSYRVLPSEEWSCPRCRERVLAAHDLPGALPCPGCGGVFLATALVERLEHDEELEDLLTRAGAEPALVPVTEEVRYLACPLCTRTMNRTTFGRRSGVVVDTCKAHGTFFDAGELVIAAEFVSSGKFAKARAREAAEREAERLRVRELARPESVELGPAVPDSSPLIELFRRILM